MRRRGEHGQAVVEFAIIGTVLLMLTVGLVDVGRAFLEYNTVAAAARYGARWGGVVGGECGPRTLMVSSATNDWCTSMGTATSSTNPFWTQAGNEPVYTGSTSACTTSTCCPTSYSGASASNSYLASNYTGSSSTTIVGSVVHHFDTTTSSTNVLLGSFTPGIDLSKTWVCVQLSARSWNPDLTQWTPFPGDVVTVYVYYQFFPISALLPATKIDLVASAQYQVEGA